MVRRGAEASWPASVPQREGTGYRSQDGEGVGLWSIDDGSS
jgi:hypothetical protein